MQKHLIDSVLFEMGLSQHEQAFARQQACSELIKTKLLPALDDICSLHTLSSQYLLIERLEIDLGRLSHTHWQEQLVTRFVASFSEQLEQAKSGLLGSTHSHIVISPEDKVEWKQGDHQWQAALHFIATGTLPWYTRNETFDLNKTLSTLLSANSAKHSALIHTLEQETALSRFVQQVEAELLAELYKDISQDTRDWTRVVSELLQIIQLTKSHMTALSTWQQQTLSQSCWRLIWQGFLQQQSQAQRFSAIKDYIQKAHALKKDDLVSIFLAEKANWQTETLALIELLLPDYLIQKITAQKHYPDTDESKERWDKNAEREHSSTHPADARAKFETQSNSTPLESKLRQQQIADREVNSKTQAKPLLTDSKPAATKSSSRAQDIESQSKIQSAAKEVAVEEIPVESSTRFSIENAGLVILAPFLQPFFCELGLIKNKTFVDEKAQQTAIQLCQYLIANQSEQPEYLLVLNKLLCGWPLDKPLQRFIQLTEQHKQEAESLLNAIVQHWSALGQTSVKGMQQTFMQRKALLREQEDHWLLQVERGPFDILLDKLPWGMSLVKLPWMQQKLLVEW